MLNERLETARPIAQKLSQVEISMNTSIRLLGELISAIPAARERVGKRVPLLAGVSACESLALAVSSASRSYREIIEAHSHFAQDRDDLGLSTISLGDVHECPRGALMATDAKLHIVQAA
jgi:hypothetical protein